MVNVGEIYAEKVRRKDLGFIQPKKYNYSQL